MLPWFVVNRMLPGSYPTSIEISRIPDVSVELLMPAVSPIFNNPLPSGNITHTSPFPVPVSSLTKINPLG